MGREIETVGHKTGRFSVRAAPGRRLVSIRFTDFGWQAVEAAAGAADGSPEDVIADACGHLLVESERGRLAARMPRMPVPPSGEARTVELNLPPRIWDSLEHEAENQGVELPRLIEHAVLLHLSDLDAGRATRTILDEPAED